MAVGTYTLPICDGCKLPWLPAGWKQDSDPRDTKKPLRCGKCKSSGWDREYKAEVRDNPAIEVHPESPAVPAWLDSPLAPSEEELTAYRKSFLQDSLLYEDTKDIPAPREQMVRCRHRMTNCPICSKEAAKDA